MVNFYISPLVLKATEKVLKRWGKRSLESLVLWGGRRTQNGDYCVVTCYFPRQHRFSAYVEVEEWAMREVLSQLYLRKQMLVAQVHTHPPGITHPSGIDRSRVPIHRDGFIHIIVPNYGLMPLENLLHCSVYEYAIGGRWRPLSASEIKERFIIDDHEVEVKRCRA